MGIGTVQLVKKVDFDPQNPEHMEAFEMLCIGTKDEDGIIRFRQHPTLRFNVKWPYTDLRTLMFHAVGRAYVETNKKVANG